MQKYLKDYMKRHGYGIDDVILCQECGARAVDLHHIKFRSHCTKEEMDQDSNLIPLCRNCHNKKHI
jgi:5-methylcytosine-specific restriction endonuclease McrA